MQRVKADELLAKSVLTFVNEFRQTRMIPPGTNGPRAHTMTSLRNGAHWLIACCRVDSWAPSEELRRVIAELRDLLLSPAARPGGFTHQLRIPTQRKMDASCGLIGPAWIMEALVAAAETLSDERCLDLAERLFFLHRYSQREAMWHVRDVDGSINDIDLALDHQIWFAACAALIQYRRSEEIRATVGDFLNRLPRNMGLSADGRIRFMAREVRSRWRVQASHLKSAVKRVLSVESNVESQHSTATLEAGYHAFSTYALGMLARVIPDHPLWRGPLVKAATSYLVTEEYRVLLDSNLFAYPYNPPGFEVPFSLAALGELQESEVVHIASGWFQEQLRRTFDPLTWSLTRNTADPQTLRARIYEATRLPHRVLAQVEVELPDQ